MPAIDTVPRSGARREDPGNVPRKRHGLILATRSALLGSNRPVPSTRAAAQATFVRRAAALRTGPLPGGRISRRATFWEGRCNVPSTPATTTTSGCMVVIMSHIPRSVASQAWSFEPDLVSGELDGTRLRLEPGQAVCIPFGWTAGRCRRGSFGARRAAGRGADLRRDSWL